MTIVLVLTALLGLFGDPDTTKVTLDCEDTSLADVLTNLTALTDVPIELDDAARKKVGDPAKLMVSVKVKDLTLTSTLKILLGPSGLAVTVVDKKKVVVTVK
jgi:hypothetical protein